MQCPENLFSAKRLVKGLAVRDYTCSELCNIFYCGFTKYGVFRKMGVVIVLLLLKLG